MPISQVFGAPAEAGVPVLVEPQAVDPTTWTLLDSLSLLKSRSYDSATGITTFVMNAIGTGSTDYSWAAGTTVTAPRMYTQLTDADGDPILSGDNWVLQVALDYAAPADSFECEVVVAVCISPTATDPSVLNGVGAIFSLSPGGSPGNQFFGNWNVNAATTNASATAVASKHIFPFYKGRAGYTNYATFNGSGTFVVENSRQANQDYSSGGLTQPLYLMVGVGTRSNATVTDGEDVKLGISLIAYKI